jgi:hypothetical protein
MSRLSHDQKEQSLAGMRLLGTKKAGALAANVTVEKLNEEIKKSAVFRKRANEALTSGKSNLADNALEVISTYALNPPPKTDRNQLTAAIALANAFIPGFRGATTVQGKIDHDVRVISAVPRPKYEIEKPKIEVLDKPENKQYNIDKEKLRLLNQGASAEEINNVDKVINDVIDGEVINE